MIAQSHFPQITKQEKKLNKWFDRMQEKNREWSFSRLLVGWDNSFYYGNVRNDLEKLGVGKKLFGRKFIGSGLEIECHRDVPRVIRLNQGVITKIMEYYRDKKFKDIEEYRGAVTTNLDGPFAYLRAVDERRGQEIIDVIKNHHRKVGVYGSSDDYIETRDKELMIDPRKDIRVLKIG